MNARTAGWRHGLAAIALGFTASGVGFAPLLAPAAGAQVTRTAPAAQAARIPERFTDAEFWKFITDMSEPAGYFRSENLLSNETGMQVPIPGLLATPRAGKVYLGVGPEQNFTYISSLKPSIAIIFDIRRGNLLQHLLYKALFELSADRAEFVSRLFSKPRPSGLDTTTTVDSLMKSYWVLDTDSALYRRNVEAVRVQLIEKHKFALTPADLEHLWWIYDQFYYAGPEITYSTGTGGGRGGGNMPDYFTITTARDGAGVARGFLATEANWRFVKDMEVRNLIVPVMADFGGPTAIRAVGKWLKERNATVTAIYASNVEQYLFQDGKAWSYYDNVAELPIDSTSVFIRSVGGGRGMGGGFGGPGGMRAPNRVSSVAELLAAYKANRINYYQDVIAISR